MATLVFSVATSANSQGEDELARIRELRLGGALAEARALAEQKLAAGHLEANVEIDLCLELARIHDRIGLHQNTRPVADALQQIEAAAAVTADPAPLARAKIELAKADYYYRAEMRDREFRAATRHADRAIELYRELGDQHAEADAVHRRGLIHLQRGEYEPARELFDRSLELDRAACERPTFRGDYERHVGFIYLLEGDVAASIPYFERSLAFRRQAGAVDASLFAASTLASAFVDLDRLEEARPHLLHAMMIAERLDSPTGKARAGLVLAQMYESSGDEAAARIAFEMTLGVAESVSYTSVAQQSRAALERLASSQESAWSRDGTTVIFWTDWTLPYNIYSASLIDGEIKSLGVDDAEDANPVYSPDGSKIAFFSKRVDGRGDIFISDPNGKNAVNLTPDSVHDYNPSWSPDGRKIAFQSSRNGKSQIYVMNSDGSEQTNISRSEFVDSNPAWAPDGSRIAFISTRSGTHEIYMIKPDGGEQTRLTNDKSGYHNPKWAPDGDKLIFHSDEPIDGVDFGSIFVMDKDGANLKRLTPEDDDDYDFNPFFSRNGKQIVFNSVRDGVMTVCVMNADGSGERIVAAPPVK